MASSLPDVYAALKSLAVTAIPDAQVVRGEVGTYQAPKQVLFADAQGQMTPLTIGYPTQFQEQYAITVEAYFYQGGEDIEAADDAALSMYVALINAINADRTLGLPQPMMAYVGSFSHTAGFDENPNTGQVDGVSGRVQFTVDIRNVIT